MLGGCVEIHAYQVHAALYRLIERVLQLCLIHIVLVLSHADTLRIYLDKFCQRIHQAATYRDSTTNRYILVGELFACDLGGRIDRSPILADGKHLRLHFLVS